MDALAFDRDFAAVPGRVERLSPLIRRVLCNNPSPFTFAGTASFVVGNGQVAIVDPGPENADHLAALLDAIRGETVTHILVTHSHRDHSPLATALKAATGAPILGMPLAPHRSEGPPQLEASIDHDFRPDRAVAHGDRIDGAGWRLDCVHTPGHLSNHVCYALPQERALFSGDHVMAWATTVIAPPDGHMGQYLASLRLLLDRDDAVYHPAHGPSRPDPKPLVRALLVHRQMREEAIYNQLRDGARDLTAIVAAVYAGLDPRLFGAAAKSAEAHLDHLVELGRVRRNGDVYRPA